MIKRQGAIVSFTSGGKALADRLEEIFSESFGDEAWEIQNVHRPIPFDGWMKAHFQTLDLLLFIGAMGIVVRGMAPCLQDKKTDPAVVVLDEKGQFAISVLSGHLGGANEFAEKIAELLGGTAVITTASDVNGKIAIDVFAKKNALEITSMTQAKLCAAKILSGSPVSFLCDGETEGTVPEELSAAPEKSEFQVMVSPYCQEEGKTHLHLVPKAFVLGIGCKRGITEEQIEKRVEEELLKKKIDPRSICSVGTIDLKKEEEGLLSFCRKRELPLHFYTGEELLMAEGNFTPSHFVRQITGVDNVCERAGFLEAKGFGAGSLEQCLISGKSGKDGVTVAIFKIDWRICFE